MTVCPDNNLALVPPVSRTPARFQGYPAELVERAFEIWSSIAFRSGARTVRLLGRELGEDAPLPTPSTVNRWALDGAWTAKADASLTESHGKTLFQLQCGWLAGLQLAQKTLLDGMAGEFDELPFGGAGRLKAAELVLRTIERAGLLAILPQPPEQESRDDWDSLTREEKEARMHRAIRDDKKRGEAR